ncbi:MAG: alpha-amylase family glycosyl hydrolase, partial [Actinomycetota bacterium]|nr:alpha-amylase family glycosyl hydrolase [Actinomycetota bacterium]
YDVVDPTSISDELGGEEAFRALVAAAHEAGLGVILDIVPNHMAVDDANRYWADEELRRKFFDVDEQTGRHRRFFDIDHLAGVRQEDPEVFAETHRLALALVRDGLVDGLRIDHPDGMADPAGYLRRLADAGVERVWVEKILDPGEQLRDWPVEGTVGYEFLNDVQALFVDPAGEAALTELVAAATGDARPFGDLAFEAKLQQASTTFRPEVERLDRIHSTPDVARLLSSLPVYRTYDGGRSAEDQEVLEEAGLEGLYDGKPEEWVTRFQQTTPPVMAKGVEDTAFYRYVRLLALNDVGGDPSRFGITVEQFHEANLVRQERFPRNLLITQTHDTKRSGDVRARIGALAGMADEYVARARKWLRAGPGSPDALEQLFVFQTMLGAHPISEDRVRGYFEKALREAKRNSSWIEPDEDYERLVADFALEVPSFPGFEAFAAKVAEAGHRSSMAQSLLKLSAPGVPDIYQGDELVTLNLVDPDNRRQVDWAKRRAMLSGDEAGEARDREKLDLVTSVLRLRRERPEAFAGAYEPLAAGPDVCAFLRGGSVLVVAVLREAGQRAAIEGFGSVSEITSGRSYALVAR